jgi:Dyp-type peroxidase family
MVDRNIEPELALADIQGDILVGLQKDAQWFIGFNIAPGKREGFQRFLREALLPLITSARTALLHELQIDALKASGHHATLNIVSVNVGFSFQGLQALAVPNLNLIADAPFKAGLVADSAGLGDPTDSASEGAPDNWRLGARNQEVDGILLITGPTQTTIDLMRAQIVALAGPTLNVVYAEAGATRAVARGHEHFGFLDAVSQPGIRGQIGTLFPLQRFLQPGQNPNDPDQGLPGSDLLWPGEFVFGYAQQKAADTKDPSNNDGAPGPIADGGLPWMANGSLMAFRRLKQLVKEFGDFVDDSAEKLDMDSDLLGARLVGRWKSGAPISIAPLDDQPLLGKSALANNDFEFDDDPIGRRCPFAAHIRKAYPRNDVTPPGLDSPGLSLEDRRDISEADTERHRILRRGIPFGHELDDDSLPPEPGTLPLTQQGRGLMFVCYQTSIARQFQFLNQAWFNNPSFAPFGNDPGFDPLLGQFGNDPLLGRTVPPGVREPRPFKGALPNYPTGPRAGDISLPTDFIIPTGGGYFFMPSLSALAKVLGGL